MKRGLAIAALATLPMVSLPAASQAATATGFLTGTFIGDVVLRQTGAPEDIWLSITGISSSVNTLNDKDAVSPGGWIVTGTAGTTPPLPIPPAVEQDGTPRSVNQLAIEYLLTNPTASIFSVGSFLLGVSTQSILAGDLAAQTGVPIEGGDLLGVPVDWTIAVDSWTGGPLATTEGTFSFLFRNEAETRPRLEGIIARYFGVEAFTFPGPGGFAFTGTVTLTPVPVPAALPLLAGGLGLLGLIGWRRRHPQA